MFIGKFLRRNDKTRCCLCLGIISSSFGMMASKPMLISSNGSYILSNGIVVLNEGDLQDYLEGILRFETYNETKQEIILI